MNSTDRQYLDLVFALRDVWPLVHGLPDESPLKAECSALIRETGEFADVPPVVGQAINRRMYFAIEAAQNSVRSAFVSRSLRDKVAKVLQEHAPSKIEWIRAGNPPDGNPPARDHSMRPKEYWETRPSPAQPHHWTGGEFLDHLTVHSYPPNTIADRLVVHRQAIRDALIAGKYVPAEVMADPVGVAAAEEAVSKVRADEFAANASTAQEKNRQRFLMALHSRGYAASGSNAQSGGVRGLLLMATKVATIPAAPGLETWIAGGYKLVQDEEGGYPYPIMVCSLGDSKGVRLDFRDGRYEPNSLFSTVHSMRIEDAAPLLIDIFEKQEATAQEIQSVIGYGAMRYLERPVVQAVYPRGG